jgi:hypothetical protein
MSVVGALDAIAVKAETMSGLKRCYSATGGGISASLRPIPGGIDDGPVGVIWIGSASVEGGNAEALLINMVLDIWVQADNAGYAYKTLAAFPDRARTAFRSDMDLTGQVTRCQFVGWDELQSEEANGRSYLVLPLRLDVLITRFVSDATA